MTASTADRLTKQRSSRLFSFPLAAGAKIFAGTMVCINAAGFAVKGTTSTTLKCVGVAKAQVDNTNGANGDLSIEVERDSWQFANSASTDQLTLADVGSSCYIVDDQTVAKTSGSATRSIAGTVRDVDASGVWVQF